MYKIYCTWLPANNFLFQIGNVWLLVSYLCPPTFNGLICLRISLGLAGLFFALWGWIVLCALDTSLWNIFFALGNFIHLAYLLLSKRTTNFTKEMETVYEKIFKPLKVPRHQFKYLAETANSEQKTLPPKDLFVIDGVTKCDSLSILLEGRMNILKHGELVHVIKENQFINSPEWVVSEEEAHTFEVTMKCQTHCRVISWDRKSLLNIIKKNIYLKTVVDSVVSKDIAQKLFAMNRRINREGQRLTHSIYSLNETGLHESLVNENGFANYEPPLLNHISIHERETVV